MTAVWWIRLTRLSELFYSVLCTTIILLVVVRLVLNSDILVDCLKTRLQSDQLLCIEWDVNPLIATLKPQSNGPSYSNTVIGTLAVDGWAVTSGTARRGMGGTAARPGPSSLYQM